VYDAMIDDDRSKNAFGLMMSLQMLIETPAGSTIRAPTARSGCAKRDSRDAHGAFGGSGLDGGGIK